MEIISSYLSTKEMNKKIRFIRNYSFPGYIIDRFILENSTMTINQSIIVSDCLKDYFIAGLMSKGLGSVAMPSKIVDKLWHIFIIFTKDYVDFCNKAYGYYFHHSPKKTEVLTKEIDSKSIIRTWLCSSEIEGIDIKKKEELPLIFEIDDLFQIKNGNSYSIESLIKTRG
jgi:hypothetical protein